MKAFGFLAAGTLLSAFHVSPPSRAALLFLKSVGAWL
jgi:hypothetical protein